MPRPKSPTCVVSLPTNTGLMNGPGARETSPALSGVETTHPILALRREEVRACASAPPWATAGLFGLANETKGIVQRDILFYIFRR